MGNVRATTLGANTEVLTLPLDQPLADWEDSRIVHVPRGAVTPRRALRGPLR